MNRNYKIQALNEAFSGNPAALRQLQKERLKKRMPYREVHGIVDAYHCDPLLLSLPVHPSRDSVDTGIMPKAIPVREYIEELRQGGSQASYDIGDAYGFIDPNDSQFDQALLHCLWVRFPNYSNRYVPNKRVRDLRQVFWQTRDSMDKHPFITLIFECDPSKLIQFNEPRR